LREKIGGGSRVCKTAGEARADLSCLRYCVAEEAGRHGLGLIAVSTHPFAQWDAQKHVDKERYNVIARDMKTVVRRLVICGMHVHVAVEDDDLRIDLMNQIRYFLPHLLALSTSSPFWRGEDTGLRSYRCSIFKEMPRTGLPDVFDSFGEYRRHVAVLEKAGVIEDATKLWWDVRPSARFPTLEMRMTDVCTRLDDAIAIAALFQCLLSMLYRLRRQNQRWRTYARLLIEENRWRAQRYGLDQGLVDFGRGEIMPYSDLLEEVIELVMPDAEALGCVAELNSARDILVRGTSAHNQQALYAQAIEGGASPSEALRGVVDWLLDETLVGVAG